jgi:hypothetical protein
LSVNDTVATPAAIAHAVPIRNTDRAISAAVRRGVLLSLRERGFVSRSETTTLHDYWRNYDGQNA